MTKDEINNHLSAKHKAAAGGVIAGLEAARSVRRTTTKRAGAGRPATMWALVR
jgi:hypothetical protein